MFTGDTMSGVAVVISDTKSVALVNVIGPIDIDTLVQLSGHLNVPKIDIEKETINGYIIEKTTPIFLFFWQEWKNFLFSKKFIPK